MSISSNNPVGLLSVDYLEFTCEKLASPMTELFHKFGFTKTHENKNNSKELYEQGQVRFLVNIGEHDDDHSRNYFKNHGEGVCTMAFRVKDAKESLKAALSRGAELVQDVKEYETSFGIIRRAKIKGFGDVHNEFIERPDEIVHDDLVKIEDKNQNPLNVRLSRIDHLTNNVPKGEMDKWVKFYEDIYGFVQTRFFDIKGLKTGLLSKVVQLENNSIIIPINEPEEEGGKSQIQEFLDLHNGAGVQHIALTTPSILDTVGELRSRDIQFLDIPYTYYEDISKRGIHVTEDIEDLYKNQLLVDGDEKGYLIQNFTKTYIGPLFFEIIQRKNNNGFGEGNFQALFDSIERDQKERGYLS